jgi:hypothetical protein
MRGWDQGVESEDGYPLVRQSPRRGFASSRIVQNAESFKETVSVIDRGGIRGRVEWLINPSTTEYQVILIKSDNLSRCDGRLGDLEDHSGLLLP